MTLLLERPPVVQERLITGEELAQRADLGYGELIKGKFLEMPPPNYEHGIIESNVGFFLKQYARRTKSGLVMVGEAGIYTDKSPDSVRGGDVIFISHERFAQVESNVYLDAAPELVVEVMSPSNRWTDMRDKIDEYFEIGVLRVWVVYPKRKQVFVYRAPDDVRRYSTDETLTDPDILPDFSLPVSDIFEQ